MKKYITSGLLLLASLSFAYAQTADIDTSSSNSCAIISSNLRYLNRDANGSTDVSILQDFLNGRGYLKSQPTGFFGSATRRAVIAFQNDNGLRATPPGYVGPGTRAKIKEIDCNDTSAVNTTPVTYNNTPTYTAPTTQTTNNTYQYQNPIKVVATPVITSMSEFTTTGFGNIVGTGFNTMSNAVTINGITKQLTTSARGDVIPFFAKDFNLVGGSYYSVTVSADNVQSNSYSFYFAN